MRLFHRLGEGLKPALRSPHMSIGPPESWVDVRSANIRQDSGAFGDWNRVYECPIPHADWLGEREDNISRRAAIRRVIVNVCTR